MAVLLNFRQRYNVTLVSYPLPYLISQRTVTKFTLDKSKTIILKALGTVS